MVLRVKGLGTEGSARAVEGPKQAGLEFSFGFV